MILKKILFLISFCYFDCKVWYESIKMYINDIRYIICKMVLIKWMGNEWCIWIIDGINLGRYVNKF